MNKQEEYEGQAIAALRYADGSILGKESEYHNTQALVYATLSLAHATREVEEDG